MIVREQFWCEKVKKAKGSHETLHAWYSPKKRELVGKGKEKADTVQQVTKKRP